MNATQYRDLSIDLANARAKRETARMLMEHATTKAAKRFAAEDVEFWGNKAAFLAAWIAKEG